MTRGPEISPTTVASTPKFARQRASASAMRLFASAFGPVPGADACSSDRSGSRYSGCGVASASKSDRLRVLGRVVRGRTPASRTRIGGARRDEVGVVVDGVDRRLELHRAGGTSRVSGSSVGAGRRGGARPLAGGRASRPADGVPGAADERAERGAGQEERADERRAGRRGSSSRSTRPRARRALRAAGPTQPPWLAPSASISPTTATRQAEPERPHARRARCG